MTTDPRSLAGRLLAVLILAVLVWLAYTLLFAPGVSGTAQNISALTQTRGLVEKYTRLAGRKDEIVARLAELEQNTDWQNTYLQGESHALAGAELQRYIQSLLEDHGADLKMMRLQSQNPDKSERVDLQVSVELNYEMLTAILLDIETAEIALVVDQLTVREKAPSARPGADNSRNLATKFVVSGLADIGEDAP
ncbi:type II secretion system protein GspM [Emcibacter nanhaiensis]|uniref:Type II secretion system protein M n=1 Tax=Emcibacter nanhaiensis TaxID=1505037 RepID=A0A501PJF6_9PROT|nr:type II secretion system protein GspM [Emcibacter nanhaiensis]TPD60162.1 hypothetical protein FIV46_08890 [Emcibacter nanhaiensis]